VTPTDVDTNELLADATVRFQQANALTITSVEDLDAASELFNQTRSARDSHERSRVAEKEPHLEAGRQVDARWKPILTTLDSAATAITAKINAFKREAQRRAEEEQRRLRAEQEKERARLLRQAERAETKGLPQTADALVREAETIQPAIVAPAVPRHVPGIQTVEKWDFVIEDPAQLPRNYTTPDMTAIRRTVQALKGKTEIPGVRVFREDSIRRGR
jgi:hypothetical protein